MLRAARGSDSKPYGFSRWSWYRFTTDSVLSINNPIYYKNENIFTDWYLGNKSCDGIKDLSEIIKKIAKICSIREDHIILYGSSAGGTASIHLSKYLKQSFSVAINFQMLPDTRLSKQFTNCLGYELNSLGESANTSDIIRNAHSKMLLICNICSEDFEYIYKFAKNNGINVKYGLTKIPGKDLWIWLYQAFGTTRSGHYSFENRTLFYALDYCIKSIINNGYADAELINIIGEFWNEQYYNLTNRNVSCAKILLSTNDKGNIIKAIKLLSSRDNPIYSYYLGKIYYDGNKVIKKDLKKAMTYFNEAVRYNILDSAEYLIKIMIQHSKQYEEYLWTIVNNNLKNGLQYYGWLGKLYAKGIHCDKNIVKSIECYRLASNYSYEWEKIFVKSVLENNYVQYYQDVLEICTNNIERYRIELSTIYVKGLGVDVDYSRSYSILKPLVNKKDPIAIYKSFDVLWKIDTDESRHKMIVIIQELVNENDPIACSRLARAYRYGKGVEKDLNIAKKLYMIGVEGDVLWAKKELDDLNKCAK